MSATVEKQAGSTFYDQVTAITNGDRLKTCLQCGTCGGSCPSGPDMDYTPRELFALILADEEEKVLKSNTFWYCLSCYYCTVRCPQEIPITEIMYRLKYLARTKDHSSVATNFSKTFILMVENFGRSFELGLAAQYYLTNRPLAMFGMAPMAIGLLSHNRMAIIPTRIKDLDGMKAILNKAKEISRQRNAETGAKL